ncbi:MAG: hypothetical protein KDK22_11645 [Rhodobacteraceae bacterium]|nr:hypothetical protein [Paracoccaceae bacterium]
MAEDEGLRFNPCMLFLSRSAACVAAGLRGERLSLREALPLRSDVSTDEITPIAILTHYDHELARFPYTGFTTEDRQPVGPGAVVAAGIEVVVAGKRYGKGSSREHSPAAERAAGVRLVIAESFERIYRQNADNIGLLTSTDLGLVDRIAAGEAIALTELLQDRDELTQAILRAGGLLRFGQAHMQDLPLAASQEDRGPQTLFDKIVERHALASPAAPYPPTSPRSGVFVRPDWRFIHEYYTGMAAHMLRTAFGPAPTLHDPEHIVVFEDHTSYVDESPTHVRMGLVPKVHRMVQAQRDFAAEHRLHTHRTLTETEAALDDGRHVAGISHAMMTERHALPGQLVIGTDSHTPHAGALGCAAFGVGTTDMANAFMTGAVRTRLPGTVLIWCEGRLDPGVTAKDLMLHLLSMRFIRDGGGVGQVFEFAGPAVSALPIDERATLTNMTAELGGLTGIVAPDRATVDFLRERRGIAFTLEPWMCSDPDAAYTRRIDVDCCRLSPMVARPGDPGRGVALADLDQPVRIDIAYGGSCTAGKLEDFRHYHAVLRWAADRGLRVAPGVALFLQFGTTAVRDACIEAGFLDAFGRVGARMLQPSCGACGNCGPGGSIRADQVTVSAINRNFPGRGGPGSVWLASPPTVAASAIAGELISFADLQRRHGQSQ